jgi:endonuclease/exonuclease/phosphatase family metal-dependent hydrolase
MRLRILSWNLMHGRSVPGAGRDLFMEFLAALGSWDWDVALLQEVPPWWTGPLARSLHGEQRSVPTSRNSLPALRRALARRWPDAIRSNGGGANAILVRDDRIAAHRLSRLCRFPERRWVHAVRLGSGIWVGNLHASTARFRNPLDDGRRAAAASLAWAGREPLVLGGDFNLGELTLHGLEHAGGTGVDHVFVAGLKVLEPARPLERGRLSDHAPVSALIEWELG